MGRNTNVLQNRRQNRQAKAGWQAWSKRTRSLGHGLSLPWYAPRRGPGGQHGPTVTNQRPSGTVKPHASSRGTGSIPRAGRQPHAWRWGGMAPEAKASGKARGYADGRPVVWKVRGQSECTRHEHGTTSDVCMARYPVAQSRAGGLQAPTAHLPSQSSWRRQDCTQAPATLDEVLVSQTWHDGPQAIRDSRHGGSRRTSPGETRLGTGMGGEVRAQ